MAYLFYFVLLLHSVLIIKTAWPFFRKETTSSQNNKPPFTIIICAHNELENLKILIPQLLIQNYPNFEIIVVLDRCTDHSLDYLQNLKNSELKVLPIETIPDYWNPKKYGLNEAISLAKNDWLLLIDADCLPPSINWIDSYAKLASPNKELILGVGAYHEEKHLVSQLTAYETFQTACKYISASISGTPYMGVGRNIAYRKSAFKRKGGFDGLENITGGDDDLLVQKLATADNTAVNLKKHSLTYSSPKRTWKGYLNQKTRHLSVGKHYKSVIKFNLMVQSIVHALVWLSFIYLLIFLSAPIVVIGSFVILMVIKGLIYNRISTMLGLPFHMSVYPILDFVYALILPLLGVRANVIKRITWK